MCDSGRKRGRVRYVTARAKSLVERWSRWRRAAMGFVRSALRGRMRALLRSRAGIMIWSVLCTAAKKSQQPRKSKKSAPQKSTANTSSSNEASKWPKTAPTSSSAPDQAAKASSTYETPPPKAGSASDELTARSIATRVASKCVGIVDRISMAKSRARSNKDLVSGRRRRRSHRSATVPTVMC